jgi:hypothetical protein
MENNKEREDESLKDEMTSIQGEARMVLPGIQALFGFQTVVIFNERFQDLPDSAAWAHVLALALNALAIALVMTPAAYHRMTKPREITRHLVELCSRLITVGMVPLMCSLALDMYVILVAATEKQALAIAGALGALCIIAGLWFAFPLLDRDKRK